MKLIKIHRHYFQAEKIKTKTSPISDSSYEGVVKVLQIGSDLEGKLKVGDTLLVNPDAGREMPDKTILLMEDYIYSWVEL
jgi:hypothetical protein